MLASLSYKSTFSETKISFNDVCLLYFSLREKITLRRTLMQFTLKKLGADNFSLRGKATHIRSFTCFAPKTLSTKNFTFRKKVTRLRTFAHCARVTLNTDKLTMTFWLRHYYLVRNHKKSSKSLKASESGHFIFQSTRFDVSRGVNPFFKRIDLTFHETSFHFPNNLF